MTNFLFGSHNLYLDASIAWPVTHLVTILEFRSL